MSISQIAIEKMLWIQIEVLTASGANSTRDEGQIHVIDDSIVVRVSAC